MTANGNHPSLLVGGSGFLGRHLARRLAENFREVWVIDRVSPPDDLLSMGVQVALGDVANAETYAALPREWDTIYYLAGVRNTVCEREPRACYESMVLGLDRAIEFALQGQVRKIVFASSAIVYGEPQVSPIPEDHPLGNRSRYALAKRYGESKIETLAVLTGAFDYSILRFFNIYGPGMPVNGGDPEVSVRWLRSASREGRVSIWGDGSQSLDLVYVDDVTSALIRAASAETREKVFNIGTGIPTSLKDMAGLVRNIVGKPVNIVHEPIQRANVPKSKVADIRLAREHLGFDPTVKLETGLKRLHDWMAEAGAL